MPIAPPSGGESLSDLWQEAQDGAAVPIKTLDLAGRAAIAAARGALCGGGELLDFAARRSLAPRRARKNAQAVAGILKLACPSVAPGDPVPPSLSPAFEKGQCPGVTYIVTTKTKVFRTFPQCSDLIDSITARSYQGPIRSITKGAPFPSGCGNQPPEGFKEILITYGILATSGQHASTSGNTLYKEEIEVTIERQDGLPDECGEPTLPPVDPPNFPIIPPGSPSPPIPTIDPDGNPGPPIIIAPSIGPIFIGVGGIIVAPVNINISGPTINAPINIPVNVSLPDFNPTFVFPPAGTKPGPGDPFPDPGPPEEICCEPFPEEDDDPQEDEPLPEEEEEFESVVGATVRCDLSDVRATAIFPKDPAAPTLYVPRLGSLYFRIESEAGNLWTVDHPIKSVEQYVPAPPGARVIAARFDPERGVTGTTRLVKQSSNRKKP